MQLESLYTIIDEIIKMLCIKDDIRSETSNTEIIFIFIVSFLYFNGNYAKTLFFLTETKYLNIKITRSRYSRRLNNLNETLKDIFGILSEIGKQEAEYYQIDSAPFKLCHNIRINRCRLCTDKSFRGYNASKKEYFYGYKIQIITSNSGYFIEIKLTPGSYSDTQAFDLMDFDLPENSEIYSDNGYICEYMHEILKDFDIKFKSMKRKNQKSWNMCQNYIVQTLRHTVETWISKISNLQPKKIHATNQKGFEIKIFGFFLALNFQTFLKKQLAT